MLEGFPFRGYIQTNVAMHCVNPHTKNQSYPFTRFATMRERYTSTDKRIHRTRRTSRTPSKVSQNPVRCITNPQQIALDNL